MRLFAAIRPPLAIAVAAVAAVEKSATSLDLDLRIPPVEQVHLTLAFYGEVADHDGSDLASRLERAAARSQRFEMALRGAGAFSRRRAATVVWLGIEEPTGALQRLAERAIAAGRRAGIAMEDRRWRAHLTVGRSRHPFDAAPLLDALAGLELGPWTVDEVELVQSRLGAVVVHEPIARFSFPG